MSFLAEMNGDSVVTVRRCGDLMSRAISSKASRYCRCRVINGEETTEEMGHTAVATSDWSISSYFPPGKAV